MFRPLARKLDTEISQHICSLGKHMIEFVLSTADTNVGNRWMFNLKVRRFPKSMNSVGQEL